MRRKRFAAWLAAALVAAGGVVGTYYGATGGSPGPATALSGSVSLTDQTWTCNTAVDLDSVTVTIDSASTVPYGIKITRGCSGTVGTISVVDAKSDAVHIDGGSNVTINGGSISCTGIQAGAHQDGIQATSGDSITFNGVDDECATANNSGFFVNGITGQTPPNAVIFNAGKIGPTQSKTASVSDNQTNSGISNSTLCPSRFFTYQKQTTAIDVGNTYPASC